MGSDLMAWPLPWEDGKGAGLILTCLPCYNYIARTTSEAGAGLGIVAKKRNEECLVSRWVYFTFFNSSAWQATTNISVNVFLLLCRGGISQLWLAPWACWLLTLLCIVAKFICVFIWFCSFVAVFCLLYGVLFLLPILLFVHVRVAMYVT